MRSLLIVTVESDNLQSVAREIASRTAVKGVTILVPEEGAGNYSLPAGYEPFGTIGEEVRLTTK